MLKIIKKLCAVRFKARVNVVICGLLAITSMAAMAQVTPYKPESFAKEIIGVKVDDAVESIALEGGVVVAKGEAAIVPSPSPSSAKKAILGDGTASYSLASRGDLSRYTKVYTMSATGYDPCMICTGKTNGVTASGIQAVKGVVAVDPKVIPLGSRVYVETAGGEYIYGTAIAGDTGGAIKGNKIDLCFGSHEEALSFGRRTVNVYVE